MVVMVAIVYDDTNSRFAPALSYATGVLQLLGLDAVRVKSRGLMLYATHLRACECAEFVAGDILLMKPDLLVKSFWGVTMSLKDVKRTTFINICTLLVKVMFSSGTKGGDKLMWLEGRVYRMPEEDQTR